MGKQCMKRVHNLGKVSVSAYLAYLGSPVLAVFIKNNMSDTTSNETAVRVTYVVNRRPYIERAEEYRRRQEELERQKEVLEYQRRVENDERVYRQWLG